MYGTHSEVFDSEERVIKIQNDFFIFCKLKFSISRIPTSLNAPHPAITLEVLFSENLFLLYLYLTLIAQCTYLMALDGML